MIKFNKVIITAILIFLLIVLVMNLALHYATNRDGDKYYMIEVNRAYSSILENGKMDGIAEYRYIKSISYLSADADAHEVTRFFESGNESYVVKTLQNDEGLTYIKFTYIYDFQNEYSNIRTAINICFAVMGLSVLIVLIYIKRQIIKPFNEIGKMPYELSKGHLTGNLKESKNRFFGRFLWGIDMLRESLEAHKAKQLSLEKEKKTLILSISHDIKTPLSAIKLYARALSAGLYDDREKQLEIIGKIDENTVQIERFVNDIIQTTQNDFLNIEVRDGEFYIADFFQQLNIYYKDKTEYLKIEYIVHPVQNCLVYGDRERCLEAFENIIENAIKYGDGKRIEIHVGREEDCLLITVSNTGNTLPEGELVHIFDSFWRGSNATDKKGSGLGLYICRQILAKMKGDIFAEIDNGNMGITVVLKVL